MENINIIICNVSKYLFHFLESNDFRFNKILVYDSSFNEVHDNIDDSITFTDYYYNGYNQDNFKSTDIKQFNFDLDYCNSYSIKSCIHNQNQFICSEKFFLIALLGNKSNK